MHAENLFHLSAYSQTFLHYGCHVGHIRDTLCLRSRTCAAKRSSSTRLVVGAREWVYMCTQNLRARTGYIFSSP